MNKDFDCVEMKHKAQEIIRAELRGKSRAEELAYWQRHAERLREQQRQKTRPERKSA